MISLIALVVSPAQREWQTEPPRLISLDEKRHSKPRQPEIKMKLGDVQRVEDEARSTCRWVGDFSKNRRRGHSMPPRSRKLKK